METFERIINSLQARVPALKLACESSAKVRYRTGKNVSNGFRTRYVRVNDLSFLFFHLRHRRCGCFFDWNGQSIVLSIVERGDRLTIAQKCTVFEGWPFKYGYDTLYNFLSYIFFLFIIVDRGFSCNLQEIRRAANLQEVEFFSRRTIFNEFYKFSKTRISIEISAVISSIS